LKILVISDIHSNSEALESVLRDAGEFDAGVCCGDIVGYGPNPSICIDTIVRNKFHCVRGNHDNAVAFGETAWFNEEAQEAIRINRSLLTKPQLDWLGNQPLELHLNLGQLAVYHGSPTDPLTKYIFPTDAKRSFREFFKIARSNTILLGHTHMPYVLRNRGRLMINPGSVGQPRDGDDRASYMSIDTDSLDVTSQRVSYDIEATVKGMKSLDIPQRLAMRLYYGI
jgi:predicted phosphodiesterase